MSEFTPINRQPSRQRGFDSRHIAEIRRLDLRQEQDPLEVIRKPLESPAAAAT